MIFLKILPTSILILPRDFADKFPEAEVIGEISAMIKISRSIH